MTTNALQMTPLTLPVGSLETYIYRINQIPLLTAEQEQELALRFRDQGDLEAAKKMVMAHLRYVVRVARGYMGYGLALNDLVQEGNIGLMKAVKRFDPTMGVRLVSFAVHWIKAEIHEFVLRNWRIVKVATTKAQRKLFFNLRQQKKRLGWFTDAEVNAVANDLGVSYKDVLQMEQRLNAMDMTFDVTAQDDDDNHYAPANYLEDQSADPAQLVESEDWADYGKHNLSTALATLDERSIDILKQRWLNEKKATLHDLAAKYDISAERIRQLEKNAMNKLKVAMQN